MWETINFCSVISLINAAVRIWEELHPLRSSLKTIDEQ